MKELIDKTIALRSKCRDYGEKVNGLLGYSTDSDDPRSGCFGMVFNKSTLCLELLAYYYKLWGKPPARLTSEEVEEKKRATEEEKKVIEGVITSISSYKGPQANNNKINKGI